MKETRPQRGRHSISYAAGPGRRRTARGTRVRPPGRGGVWGGERRAPRAVCSKAALRAPRGGRRPWRAASRDARGAAAVTPCQRSAHGPLPLLAGLSSLRSPERAPRWLAAEGARHCGGRTRKETGPMPASGSPEAKPVWPPVCRHRSWKRAAKLRVLSSRPRRPCRFGVTGPADVGGAHPSGRRRRRRSGNSGAVPNLHAPARMVRAAAAAVLDVRVPGGARARIMCVCVCARACPCARSPGVFSLAAIAGGATG